MKYICTGLLVAALAPQACALHVATPDVARTTLPRMSAADLKAEGLKAIQRREEAAAGIAAFKKNGGKGTVVPAAKPAAAAPKAAAAPAAAASAAAPEPAAAAAGPAPAGFEWGGVY